MSQTAERPQIAHVQLDDLDAGDGISLRDYGNVPLVHDGVVLTDRPEIRDRMESLAHNRGLLNECDELTSYEKERKYRDKIDQLEEVVVVQYPDPDVESKEAAVRRHVGVDPSAVPERMLTSLLFAEFHDAATGVELLSGKGVKIHLDDDVFHNTTDNHIELTTVGDAIVVLGRGTLDGSVLNTAFPDSFLEERDVVERVVEMLDGKASAAI